MHAVSFFAHTGRLGFLVLGAVILVVVGGEALYADLGHFGRAPIAWGWYGVVLPSLVLAYFGQGALLIRDPSAIDNPFYRLAPGWALYPLVALATAATIIASQALISGAFSLARQAVQLGFSPRLVVRHTSETHVGQIYVPVVNWSLMLACLGLVLGFQRSQNLAAAYGVAVAGTMLITTVLFFFVVRERFHWSSALAVPLCVTFLVVDASFFVATLFKLPHGGWFPLVMGAAIFTLMTTWRTGRALVRRRLHAGTRLDEFLRDLARDEPVRAPGVGAYLFGSRGVVPPALDATLRHHGALHEQVLVITVELQETPRVDDRGRVEVEDLGHGFREVVLRFGFMEDPDVPRALSREADALGLDLDAVSYLLGRESIQVTARPGMAPWREHLFALMSRNATSAVAYFRLPPEQTIEIGAVVAL
jgi:KUP system potassium uptake protein